MYEAKGLSPWNEMSCMKQTAFTIEPMNWIKQFNNNIMYEANGISPWDEMSCLKQTALVIS